MDNVAFQGLIGLSLAMYLWLISAGLTIIFGEDLMQVSVATPQPAKLL